ncbi:MAG TPA: fibro-slime domain-containing protein [Polyangiaceae bacterium]|jgi:fibro-slime domain-containing protein
MNGARFLPGLVAVAFLVGCGSSSSGEGFGDGGANGGNGGGASDATAGGQAQDAPPVLNVGDSSPTGSGGSDAAGCGHIIQATIRDFKPSNEGGHPDFENDAFTNNVATTGLVKEVLGTDGTPDFNSLGSPTQELTGPTEFAQWYHDTTGVNIPIPVTLTLTESPPGSSTYVYQNDAFFPIDGQGFGNGPPLLDGSVAHNFSFTTEVHLEFAYNGGEVFSFRGDDDLWVFINKHLAIDLGGLHPELDGSANLDAMAATLAITKGQTYALDIFHAERHTDASHFNLTTTIQCLTPAPPR